VFLLHSPTFPSLTIYLAEKWLWAVRLGWTDSVSGILWDFWFIQSPCPPSLSPQTELLKTGGSSVEWPMAPPTEWLEVVRTATCQSWLGVRRSGTFAEYVSFLLNPSYIPSFLTAYILQMGWEMSAPVSGYTKTMGYEHTQYSYSVNMWVGAYIHARRSVQAYANQIILVLRSIDTSGIRS